MSELYKHLLIPNDSMVFPELRSIADFFNRLDGMHALPKSPEFITLTNSGKTRPIASNPVNGETLNGPDLKISRHSGLQEAIDSMTGRDINELWVQGTGPTAISPFALYGANRPDVFWSGPYPLTVRCRLREKVTHLLHSGFGCKCDMRGTEAGIFENPWNHKHIETTGPAWGRFWIEFGVGEWLMPMIADSLEILDARLVLLARETFGVEFVQGCICNDD